MVDFEGGKRGGFERDESFNDALLNGSNEYQESPANISAGTRIVVADANGVVHLPAGTTLDDFSVQGRDLVITLADGSTILIPDGAINTPQIVIDGIAISPMAVSAALNGLPMSPDDEGFNPDALPNPPSSSGGSFDDGDLFLQDAFDLGNLLPYTELAFEPQPEEEIIPFQDEDPDVVIETPDNPIGVENAIATVAERGLPARGDEPQGTADETSAETTTGTIIFSAPDGLSAIILNGVEITTVGQEFVTPFGTLTITSINLDSGEIGFSYTLADNLLGLTEDGNFFVTVVDRDGDTADASLKILVEDDSPIAAADIGIVPGGSHAPITGNVLENDESGADDYPVGEEGPDAVTGFSSVSTGGSAEPGDSLQGEYGVLTLNADGSYTYVRDFNTPGGVNEVFNYTIVDQDGSTSTTTLTINIADAPNTIEIPDIGEGTIVDEGGLAPRDGEPVGTGEGADGIPDNNSDTSEGTGSTITFNSPDGLGSITIGGVEVNLDNLAGNDADDQVIIDDATGTLVITAVTYDPVTGDGSITYEYTLGDNTSGDDTTVSFEVVVTDLDGDVASDDLVIAILDDEPEAFDDSATQDLENAPVTVDVFANDIEGADGVALDTIALVEGTLTGAGTLVNNGDGTFTYTPAPGEEGTVTFDYSITDGDGDSSTATVTIDLLDDSTPEIFVEGDDVVNESGLDGPPDSTFEGSDSGANSEIATGVIGISTGGDTIASLVINGTNVTGGGTVAGAYGTLTVTFDGTDYSYSYELGDNIADLAGDEVDSFSLTVTDSDGDEADTTLDITVIDDVPDAVDDTFNQQAENAPVVGDVSTNDVGGADGAASFAENGDLSGTGTLDFNSDGSFTYTPGAGEQGTVTFTYTVTDGDGDPSTATVTINLLEDSVPAPDDAVAAVDDDGLGGANAGADAATDLDADAGDSGAGLGDESVFVGTFTADFGNDGPGTFTLAGMNATSGTVGAESVDYSWDAGSNTLTATISSGSRTGTDLFTVAVNPTSGQYTVTLLTNVLHTDDGTDTENDASAVLTFTAIDSDDNDAVDGTLTITFDDDVPSAADDTYNQGDQGGENTAVTGDVSDNDAEGADSPASYAYNNDHNGTGTLDFNSDGSFTYTPADGEEGTVTFSYTLTDADGDESTASVTINLLEDSVPAPDDAVAAVDDDGLGGANAGADAATDLDADAGDSGAGLGDESVFVGTFTADFGNDGPGTFTLAGMNATSGTVGTESVDYSWDAGSNTLTATISSGSRTGTDLFTVAVNPTSGQYTVTLLTNVLHADDGTDTENDASAVLTFTAIDSDDNDAVDGTLTITFDDDVPTANNDGSLLAPIAIAEDTSTPIDVFANDVEGADGVALGDIALETDATNGTAVYNGDGTFTYTPDAGYAGPDSFTYTITDGDGDTSTATVFVNVGADSAPEFNAGNAVVDEDGLPGANVDSNPLQVSPAETDSTEDNTDTVNFTVDFGNDTPLDVDAAIAFINPDNLDGQLSSNGQPVDFALDGNGDLVGTVDGGATEVIRISLNAGTDQLDGTVDYSYTVTLSQPLDHADDESENTALLTGVTIEVTDSDGTQSPDTFTVTIVDDVPTANNDTDSTAEGGFTAGNVVLGTGSPDGTAGADVSGADGFGTPTVIGITSVNQGTSDSTADDGFGNFVLAGEYGTLTLNQNGNYIYQSNPDTVLPPGETDVFTYTIVDADGDTSTATLTITILDVSRQPDNQTKTVFEAALDLNQDDRTGTLNDDLAAGNVEGSQPGLDTETVSGQLNVVGATSYSLISFTDNYGEFQLNADGSYTYTLTDPVLSPTGNNSTNTFTGVETIVYEAKDANGNTVQGTITIDVVDDVPTANDDTFNQVSENADVVGDVKLDNGNGADVEGADGAASYVYNDDHNGQGTLDFLPDGTFTYTPADGEEGTVTFTYTLSDGDGDESTATVTINLQDDSTPTAGTVTARLDDDGLPGGNGPNVAGDDLDADLGDSGAGIGSDTVFMGTLTGNAFNDGPATFSLAGMVGQTDAAGSGSFAETISYTWSVDGNTGIGTLTAVSDVRGAVFTVSLDTATGGYTVTLLQNWLHDGGNDGELPGGVDSLNLTYTVSDSDTPADTANGTLTIQFGDDAPNDFTPVDLTDTTGVLPTQDDALVNSGTATATRLINDPNNDGIGTNFIGADGFGSLTFTGGTDGVTTFETTGGDPITSGGDTIYLFGFGTGTLIGTTDPTNTDAAAKVFTVTLNTGTGAGDDATYTIDFDQPLDDGSGFVFDDFSSAPAGQNRWIGLDADGVDINLSQNDSEDLLITGLNGGTVNTSATDIGSNNQWIDENEGLRLDYVTDVARDPGQDEKDAGGYTFDAHYLVTDSSFTVMQVKSGGAQAAVTISLFLDSDAAPKDTLSGTPVDVDFSSLTVTDANGVDITALYTNGNPNDGNFVDNGDGTVTVTGLGAGYTVSFEGVTDFNAVEYSHGGGDDFALGAFGFNSVTAGNDLTFSFDVLATDGDGDTSTGTIDITVTPDTSVTPVVLDLDGGGNEFTSLSGGLAYDYNGDGVKTQTAWIAAGSAILAYDLNGDNIVTDASEFVFGGNGMTDLEAIAAKYDDNGDGKLDANDAAYGKFGVWIDADLDAVSDAGEFVTLADAGISSIQLVSNGIPTIEADGDVTVYGTASFTMEDGSTGAVSDAAFATGSDVDPAMMEALLALQSSSEPADANLADATGMDQSDEAPKLAAIVDDIMAENAIDTMLDHLAGKDADFVGISEEGGYLDDGALAQMIETGAFAFAGNMVADLHEDAAALATIHA